MNVTQTSQRPADWEIGDTAGWETCGTGLQAAHGFQPVLKRDPAHLQTPPWLRLASAALFLLVLLAAHTGLADHPTPAEQQFQAGVAAYRAGDFSLAAEAFRASVGEQAAAGACQNLGNAEWQQGRVGPAILAWEQALWVSPRNAAAANNLRYARTVAQIDTPELAWYEEVSTWLPAGWWGMVTALSLWLVADLLALPGIFRHRRTGWQQALAALALTLLLLSLPAHLGWHTRSQIGFVLEADTPLRLTPTETAQEVTRVGAGEPGRCERTFGDYRYIRFRTTAGWLTRAEFGLVSGK
jgi:tetratricopeptide (TPR) repeat protein